MLEFDEELLEPLKYYKELKFQHEEAVNSFFDDLTRQAGTDTESNALTCKEYYSLVEQAEFYKKK